MTDSIYTVVGNRTLGAWLDHWAVTTPDTTYLIWDQPGVQRFSLSYAEMRDAAACGARFLTAHGIGRGKCFCVHQRNRPETVALLFAAAQTGAVMIPTNTKLTVRELGYVLQHSDSRLIITESAHTHTVTEAIRTAGGKGAIVVLDDVLDPSKLFDAVDDFGRPEPVENIADVVVLYTSGTTSSPKGVRISQRALLNAGQAIASGIGFLPEDRNLAVLPLYHVNSLCYTLMTSLVTGGSVVLSDRFSASHYFRQATETEATFGWLAATPMRMLLAQPAGLNDRKHSLRRIVFGQNLTRVEFDDWSARFGVPLQQIYGMTETVMLPLMNPLFGESHVDSMGLPALGVAARLDRGEGHDATGGQKGELLLRLGIGEQMMSGYLNDPVATAAAFEGEWFRTGDFARLGEDGFFYFIDRKRDVLKVSGENVSASEIEMILNEHSCVFDSAVVGKADELKGQVVKAFVVLQANAAVTPVELIEWCRQRLALFKVPVEIEVRNEFPRTSAGKIQKNLL